jgi:hypothetical protein
MEARIQSQVTSCDIRSGRSGYAAGFFPDDYHSTIALPPPSKACDIPDGASSVEGFTSGPRNWLQSKDLYIGRSA